MQKASSPLQLEHFLAFQACRSTIRFYSFHPRSGEDPNALGVLLRAMR